MIDIPRHQWRIRHALIKFGMASEIKGEAMGILEAVKLIKFDQLTDKQKNDLRKKLLERKKELEAALKAVNQGLKKIP